MFLFVFGIASIVVSYLMIDVTSDVTNRQLRNLQQISTLDLRTLFSKILSTSMVYTTLLGPKSVKGESMITTAEFMNLWPYQEPKDILPYIYENAADGDVPAVLHAMDTFAQYYPQYKLTPEKATLLTNEIKEANPNFVLELGTFFGYSAINIALSMPQQCVLSCIEANRENAYVAKKILQRCFEKKYPDIFRRINVIEGRSGDVLNSPNVKAMLLPGISNTSPSNIDFLFLDHDKDSYLTDLKTLERIMLLNPKRFTMVADNVVFPGAPGFLEYVDNKSLDVSSQASSSISMGKKWKTRLVDVPFERIGFETQFKQVTDAMSISTYSS